MVFDVSKITGVGEFAAHTEPVNETTSREIYTVGERAFLVENKHTLEVRCDEKLGKLLRDKYESVMESRYFGRGGIEIVSSGDQLTPAEVEDLIRLSYNLTKATK